MMVPIDYRVPAASDNRWPWKWIIPIVGGGAASLILSVSAEGVVCVAPILGFIVAAASAIFSQKRKLAFGMLGCGVAVVVGVLSASVRHLWFQNPPIRLNEFLAAIVFLTGLVVIPGLFGVMAVHFVKRNAKSPI